MIMNIPELVLSTLISTGVITVLLSHWYDKKLRTHEIKLQKYISLTEVLAKFVGNEENIWEQLRKCFNEALLFASDDVVREILEFNKKFTAVRKTEGMKSGNLQMSATDIEPLVIAIRKDLDLKSRSIDEIGLTFFQKPTTKT